MEQPPGAAFPEAEDFARRIEALNHQLQQGAYLASLESMACDSGLLVEVPTSRRRFRRLRKWWATRRGRVIPRESEGKQRPVVIVIDAKTGIVTEENAHD